MENISELATIYPNVKILHFHVDLKNNHLDFKVVFLYFLNNNNINNPISEYNILYFLASQLFI